MVLKSIDSPIAWGEASRSSAMLEKKQVFVMIGRPSRAGSLDRRQCSRPERGLIAKTRTTRMDERTAISIGVAVVIAAALILAYFIRGIRLRQAMRRIGEFLPGYFNGEVPLDQLAVRAREVASRRFLGSPECQALVQAAFQRAAEAKLGGKAYSLEAERKLLTALADVRSEFGLPERYQTEGWKAGRE
jgi:hypothetical protein